jgi:hypothetical protein
VARKNIIITKEMDIEQPVMLAAWPGMGNVALGGIDYLRQKSQAEFFAEIDMREYLMPESVIAEQGLAELPSPPRNYFYYLKNPAVLFFESETQVSGEAGVKLVKHIIDFCKELKVQRIYTGAAFSLPISHRDPSQVFGVATHHAVRDLFAAHGIKPMEEGQISGLNGLLIGYAKQAGIEAVCLLATMPVYAVNFPNPKASKALVDILMKMTGIQVETDTITGAVTDMEQKMESIEQNLRGTFLEHKEGAADNAGAEQPEEPGKVPQPVLDRIQKMFREAKLDRNKANALKEELDRWNLYKMYEDRFLNLFKEKH